MSSGGKEKGLLDHRASHWEEMEGWEREHHGPENTLASGPHPLPGLQQAAHPPGPFKSCALPLPSYQVCWDSRRRAGLLISMNARLYLLPKCVRLHHFRAPRTVHLFEWHPWHTAIKFCPRICPCCFSPWAHPFLFSLFSMTTTPCVSLAPTHPQGPTSRHLPGEGFPDASSLGLAPLLRARTAPSSFPGQSFLSCSVYLPWLPTSLDGWPLTTPPSAKQCPAHRKHHGGGV